MATDLAEDWLTDYWYALGEPEGSFRAWVRSSGFDTIRLDGDFRHERDWKPHRSLEDMDEQGKLVIDELTNEDLPGAA